MTTDEAFTCRYIETAQRSQDELEGKPIPVDFDWESCKEIHAPRVDLYKRGPDEAFRLACIRERFTRYPALAEALDRIGAPFTRHEDTDDVCPCPYYAHGESCYRPDIAREMLKGAADVLAGKLFASYMRRLLEARGQYGKAFQLDNEETYEAVAATLLALPDYVLEFVFDRCTLVSLGAARLIITVPAMLHELTEKPRSHIVLAADVSPETVPRLVTGAIAEAYVRDQSVAEDSSHVEEEIAALLDEWDMPDEHGSSDS